MLAALQFLRCFAKKHKRPQSPGRLTCSICCGRDPGTSNMDTGVWPEWATTIQAELFGRACLSGRFYSRGGDIGSRSSFGPQIR